MTAGDRTTANIQARLRTLAGPPRSGGERQMAALLDTSPVNVNRYLRGERIPPHDFLMAVADRYNVTIDWLYGREGTGKLEEAQQAEPPWARRLDARLRYLEGQVKTALQGGDVQPFIERWESAEPPAWAVSVVEQAAKLATAELLGVPLARLEAMRDELAHETPPGRRRGAARRTAAAPSRGGRS